MSEQQLITIVAAILCRTGTYRTASEARESISTSVKQAIAIRNAVAEVMEPEGASLVAMARPESVTSTFVPMRVTMEGNDASQA